MSHRNNSRRDFLKSSAVLAAGTAVASSLSIARGAHAAGSDVMKVAVIGCGGRGSGAVGDMLNAAENLGNKIQLVAMADAFEDRARSSLERLRKQFDKDDMKAKFGERIAVTDDRIFTGFDGYKKAIAAGVDMVILATSPGFRPIHFQAAVEAGKNVFMEKPCCIDAPGYRTLVAAAKMADDKNLKVGVGFQRHHDQGYIETMQRIHDGMIGDLVECRAYWNGSGIWFRDRTPEMTEMEYQMRNWYHFVWLCGDNICEQHIHNLDVCNWAKRAHPVKANGMGACVQRYKNRTAEKGKGQIYDQHYVEFTYPDGTKMISQCRHMGNCWNSVSEYVVGINGDGNPANSLKTRDGKEWKYQAPKGKKLPPPMVQEHMDLQNAIYKNEKYNEAHNGASSSMTAVLGRMATYSGKEVTWDDAVAKGPSEMPEVFAFDAKPKALPDAEGNYPIAVPGVYKPY